MKWFTWRSNSSANTAATPINYRRLHYAMDRFRVYALDKLLREESQLAPDRAVAVRAMLLRKARIVERGAV